MKDAHTCLKDKHERTWQMSLLRRGFHFILRDETHTQSSHTCRVVFPRNLRRSKEDCKKTILTYTIHTAALLYKKVSGEKKKALTAGSRHSHSWKKSTVTELNVNKPGNKCLATHAWAQCFSSVKDIFLMYMSKHNYWKSVFSFCSNLYWVY